MRQIIHLLYIGVLISFYCTGSLSAQEEVSAFKMQNPSSSKVSINKTFRSNEVIAPFTQKSTTSLSGLAISGNVKFNDELGLVRVIMTDTNGNEYLVYESYPALGVGMETSFESICEETALLNNVTPDKIKVIVNNAELSLGAIESSVAKERTMKEADFSKTRIALVNNQLKEKIERINKHNLENGEIWFAGETALAKMSYMNRKRALNAMSDNFNTEGYEYYSSGFFGFQSDKITHNNSEPQLRASSSSVVEEFDWRNRHGVNWITSVKDQGNSENCWAFTAVGVVEAYANLHFNRKLDLDLSEQQLISCSNVGNYGSGIRNIMDAAIWIAANGIIDENCFPFIDNVTTCNYGAPTEMILPFDTLKEVDYSLFDDLKNIIIKHGPVGSGVQKYGFWSHAMPLIGWGTIKIGDRIGTYYGDYRTIEPNDPKIGITYWIFKNSYGNNANDNDGYHYIEMGSSMLSSHQYYIKCLSLSTLNHSESDRICEDRDGDGYYFWGLGPKPASCPDCAPDQPDGDDSNPHLGPLNARGECISITPLPTPSPTNITNTQSWSTNRYLCGDLIVKSGGKLTVFANLKVQPKRKIIVESGGILIVSGGKVESGTIEAKTGSTVYTQNGGEIFVAQKYY